MFRIIVFITLILVLSGCRSWVESLDKVSFCATGRTIFSSPAKVSMKEIHLDDGTLLGREIVIEGGIVTVGEYVTHLTLSDETAKMLVVLTDLTNSSSILKNQRSTDKLRVLGTVEIGKKGLPFLQARALSLLAEEATTKQSG